ncbi:hypothetical protein BHE74_00052494 [Ensete ventricosum]|nr:hypothetical protein BHE74_00052494 [Ensete ventricosum]
MWASQTTPKTLTWESSFSLAFHTKVVLSSEVVYPTPRVESYEEQASYKKLWENLDLLEERRAKVHLKALTYKKAIAKLYNRKVYPKQIMMDNLVLRKAMDSDPTRAQDKLAPN